MGMPIIHLSVDELFIIKSAIKFKIGEEGIENTEDRVFQLLGRIVSKIEELVIVEQG